MAINRLVEKEKINIYANAIFDAANASGGQDELARARNQMKEIISLIYADMNVAGALSNPDYTSEQRYKLAKAIFADCCMALQEVLSIMSQNGDAELIPRVYHAFEDVLQEKINLRIVDVVTAVSLDDNLRELIKSKTEADLGCKAMLNESVDKTIFGGIVMSTGGMRIDASARTQLNAARRTLKGTDGGES